MKILYFHQHFSTPRGSAGTRSYEMAKRLVARGHAVTIVCGSYDAGDTGLTAPFTGGRRRGNVEGIDVIEYDLSYSNSDGFLKRTFTFLRYASLCCLIAVREPADLVFSTTTPLTAGLPGIAARWIRGRKFVFEVRDLWPELPKAMGVITNPLVLKAMALLEWASYRSAHRLIALAPGIAKGIEKQGVPPQNIAIIPNGCDNNIFGAAAAWRPDGIGTDDFVAIFAGTHGKANGLDAVLDAAVELRNRGRTDIKFLLVGRGKFKPALVARADREHLTNVVFLDSQNKERLAGLLAGADAGLQILENIPAFYYGTSPNKFFDYAASGLPVVTNYPGWIADLITENRAGVALPPEDPRAFADALEAAADNRSEWAARGPHIRALAETLFARDTLGQQFVDWLEAAAGRPGKA